jgi:prepilin-type N-terminal cleavage/methylation domain-containing protein
MSAIKMGNRGFTLIEMVVVMAILAIGLSIAIPGFNLIGRANAVKAEVRGLKNVLAKTRMDAVERNQSLTANIDTTTKRCTVTAPDGATISTTDFNDVQLTVSPSSPIVWDSKGMADNTYTIGFVGNAATYSLIVSAAGNIQIIKP